MEDDAAAAARLWSEAGLTRPWNDPVEDFLRAIRGPTSAVFAVKGAEGIIGTVMVGSDGHRGWVYYLAVARAHQRLGIASALMSFAQDWLTQSGAVKLQLMVRNENAAVLEFYKHLGYETNDVQVLSRWLDV